MASLYHKPIVVTDPLTGQRVKSISKKWWGQFKDANGRLKRVPLAIDKSAAQAMLTQLVRQVEREKAGLVDPTEKERKRPIAEHIDDYRKFQGNRGVGEKQVAELYSRLLKIVQDCRWRTGADITAGSLIAFLGDLRRTPPIGRKRGRSAQTYNNYLQTAKQFTRWLVRDRRLPTDPLAHISKINTAADRRHDRRPLTQEEFTLLVAAANSGKPIQGMIGADRAMLYILAGWTGLRRGELGSLTRNSFRLDASPPTVTVAAAYSKHRRQDIQILHPDVVEQFREWLATKSNLKPDEILFVVSGRVPGGIQRDTSQMIERDLQRARQLWLQEATTDEERRRREEAEFLRYETPDGRFADFHSLRHFFITNLERAGVSPKLAQTLARHSDIRLTLGIYTHVGVRDQTAAIRALPGPTGEFRAAKAVG